MNYQITVRVDKAAPRSAIDYSMQNTLVHSNYQAIQFQFLSFGFKEVDHRYTIIRHAGGPAEIKWRMSHPDPNHLPIALLQMKPVCKFEIEPCTTGE